MYRLQYIIDASQPASDKIFDVAAFEKFLQDRIKVEGRTNNPFTMTPQAVRT